MAHTTVRCPVGEVLVRVMLLWAMVTLLSTVSLVTADVVSGCKFPNHKKNPPDLSLIQALIGKRFKATDLTGQYTYNIGICTPAIDGGSGDKSVAGVVQTETVKGKTIQRSVGRIDSAEIKIGTDWAMLEYREGDPYNSHCKGGKRVGIIMITCDPDVHSMEDVNPQLITEERNKSAECYYLFELSHSGICNYESPLVSFSLSIGSILVIVFVALCGVYVLGGVLYNRFVLGAKGMEQFPNYNFWLDFGNLQADGCNLVCRTGRRSEPRTYKGIGDDQLGDADEDRDDHLLPM